MCNRQYFSFHCFIFILFTNCIFCTAYDNAYLSDFGDSKAVFIDSEEIIRRRNIAENYLKENNNPEKDWVETYHESFSESSVSTSKKIVQESPLKNEHEVHVAFPFQNEDLPTLKNLDDSIHLYETLFAGKNFGEDSKSEIVSAKTDSNVNRQETFKSDKNVNENQDSSRSDNDVTFNSRVSKEISETNSKVVLKNSENNYSKCRSKSNKLRQFPIDCDVKDNKLDLAVKYFSKDKNDDLRLNEFKNLSIDTDKVIQIMIKNSKFSSKKYFIHGETLTLTEFNKLQEYLSSLSFLQKSKNNIYSINRMKIIDSIGKITPLLKQDEFNKENRKKSCKFSNTNSDITTDILNFEDNNLKKSAPDFKKRVGHRTECKSINTQNKLKDLSLLEHEENILPNSLKRTDRNYFFHDSEVLRRKKLMNSFIITLNDNQENWVETYHLNNINSKIPIKNTFDGKTTEDQNIESFKMHSQERFYIIRWINKLQNKLKDRHMDFHSLSISVSADLYEVLGKLSREFDIIMFDELVNNMIANATLHNYANTLYFGYENIFSAIYLPLNYPKDCIFIILLFCYILFYNLLCKTELNYNFTLYRVMLTFVKYYKWILLIIVLSSSFYLTGYKMYQQKIAQKHSVMSRVVPSYCESILNKESGVFAHVEEWFRLYWHDEDCKKYYEAVMVDASSEITFLSISTDLLSDTIFQTLQPLARHMNLFFKELTHDMSFFRQIFILIVTLSIMLFILYFGLSFFAFRRNYKVNFPFHLGSIEPTEFCKGSRVEEVEEKETSKEFSCNTSQINYYDKTEGKNYIEHVVLKEKILKIEPKQFKLDALKQYVPKAPRTRHNSI